MDWTLVAWALPAGAAATLNPCGIAMLPAYISYYLGDSERAGAQPLKGLEAGVLLAAGVLTIFTAMGVVIAGVGTVAARAIPWLALAVGIGLLVLGVATLLGRSPSLVVPGAQRAPRDRTAGSFFVFGAGYGLASLGCTLPIFMIVMSSVLSADFLSGLLAFGAYGLGMGSLLVAISLAVATGKAALVQWLRSAGPALAYVGGVGLLIAGSYLIYYNVDGMLFRYAGVASELPAIAIGVTAFVAGAVAVPIAKRAKNQVGSVDRSDGGLG